MRYCQHCGSEVHDEAVVCVKCGCSLKKVEQQKSGNSDTLLIIAKIFMLISCVALPSIGLLYGLIFFVVAAATATLEVMIAAIIVIVFLCVPLAWMLPLTIIINNKIKNHEPISIALKVCTLIFVNVVSGILLLCHTDDGANA